MSDTPAAAGMKILVVDDQEVNRYLLTVILEQLGHEVHVATNGAEAVEQFQKLHPDMVFMDVMMPVMDGYEAATRIRALVDDRFVPILFITALRDEASLIKALQHGGQDFITKPFSHAILRAKIESMQQQMHMYETLRQQRDQLAQYQQRIGHEHQVAERLFQKILHSGALGHPGIRYVISPQAIFNGDLLIAGFRPTGQLNILLGDFTGHGLSAAIGTIPVSDIFQGMTAKGFAVSEIAAEINKKMQAVLPRGLFLAACLVEVSFSEGLIRVWNGGVPEGILYDAEQGRIRSRLQARHFPLGVVAADQFDKTLDIYPIGPDDRLFMFTDGVTEAANPAGEAFGDVRLMELFGDGRAAVADQLLDRLIEEVSVFRGQQTQSDDFTLAEFRLAELERLPDTSVMRASHELTERDFPDARRDWAMDFEFQQAVLRTMDPLPLLMQMLMEIQHLHEHKEQIYLILAELYSNALEHGVLRLKSSLKSGPDGFEHYYTAREQALSTLQAGFVHFHFEVWQSDVVSKLIVQVEDSGEGFDVSKCNPLGGGLTEYHGRGLPLLRALCESVGFNDKGNKVTAVYCWRVKS